MKNRLLNFLLAIAVAITMTPVAGTVAFADTGDGWNSDIYIEGVRIDNTNCNDVLGDGTVSYDNGTNVLTLDGADLSDDNDMSVAIADNQTGDDTPLTIDVKSDSKITVNDNTGIVSGSGDETSSRLTITGNGTLTLESEVDNTVIWGNYITNNGNILIKAYSRPNDIIRASKEFTNTGSLTTEGCDGGIKTGSLVQKSGTLNIAYRNCGIECKNFDMSGGIINFNSTGEYGLAIYSDLDEEVEPGVFNISGGKMNVKGGVSAMQVNGTLNVTGGTITSETNILGIMVLGNYNIKGGDITLKVAGTEDMFAPMLKAAGEDVFEELVLGTDISSDMKIVASRNMDGSNPETFKPADYMNVYKYMHIYKPETVALKSLSISKTSYYCTGKSQGPSLTVKDVNGKTVSSANYTVSGTKKAVKPGTYKVSVKGKGNYTGTFSKSYTIKVKPTKIASLTKGTRAFTVKASALTSTYSSGYQVRYSLKKSMSSPKTVTISSKSSSVKKTVKNLKMGRTYYVQVRTVKKIDGKKYYSAWSDKKSVKTR